LIFVPFPLFGAPPSTPTPVLTPTPAEVVAPVEYRIGAIFRDLLATEDRLDMDLRRPDAVYAADQTAIAQGVTIRLGTFLGDRPDDLEFGVNYDRIFAITATQALRVAEFRRVIMSMPGILAVTRLSVVQNGSDLNVDWSATTYLGGIAAGQTTVNGGA
jgi:hypothetical protein